MHPLIRTLLREPRAPEPPPRFWFDWLLVIGFGLGALSELLLRSDIALPPLSVCWTALVIAGVHIRRWQPLLAVLLAFGLGIVVNLAMLPAAVEGDPLYSTACAMLLPYTLLRWGSGREALAGTGVILVGWAVDVATDFSGIDEAIAGVVFLMFPVMIGLTVRLQDRARRRELDQARLLEREQLARELHDSVAHHVSAIAIQAQAGRAVAATQPEAAAAVLATIEESASRTLEDMRGIVSALRSGAEADLAPQAGVADIPALAADRHDGPSVQVELLGNFNGLSPQVDTSLYRIAQEAVTNALRHARQASLVEVRVAAEADCVRLTVRDDGCPDGDRDGVRPGFGLTGMAERTKLLGGTFVAGSRRDERGWRVEAVVPVTTRGA